MIVGYKCFNKGLINRYGCKFEVGKIYHIKGKIKFGNNGNGFHICLNLEDTLRYYDAMNEEVDIAQVICYGSIIENSDEYYGYYDMYACEYMIITKVLTRKDIIAYAIKLNSESAKRFISLFRLTPEEILLFKTKYQKNDNVLNFISYYQENDLEVFKGKLEINK